MQSYSKSRPKVNKISNLATWHLYAMLSTMTWRPTRMLAVPSVSPLALLSRLCPLYSGRVQDPGSLSLFSRSWVFLHSTAPMRHLLVSIPLSVEPSFLAGLAHWSFILKSSQEGLWVPRTHRGECMMPPKIHPAPCLRISALSWKCLWSLPLSLSQGSLDQDEDLSALIEVD